MTLRIGYLIPEFPGQTHIMFWREIEALRRLGVAIRLISTRKPAPFLCRHAFAPAAIRETHYVFPPDPGRIVLAALSRFDRLPSACRYLRGLRQTGWLRGLGLFLCALDLAAWSRRERLHHLHGHSCADTAHLLALCRKLEGPRYSLTLHGDLALYGGDHRQKMEEAAFVFAMGDHLRRQILDAVRLPEARVQVSCMGIDTARIASACATRGDRPERFHVLTVARLHPAKGHRIALAALGRAVDRGVRATYVLAGDGPYRRALEDEIDRLGLRGRAAIAGTQSERRVLDLLRSSDVFILPSVGTEAWPVSVMEAMATGLPVICSRIGATPEMIRDGVDGLLVRQGDVDELAEAIERLARDPALRRRLGENARRTAAARFDVTLTASRMRDAIRAAGSGDGSPASGAAAHSPPAARRPRVLLIAESANPEWASVPLEGWSHARALADVADVHLVTHLRNRDAIRRAGWQEGRDFTAIDNEAIDRPLFRLVKIVRGGSGRGWTTFTALATLGYYGFEHKVWRQFGGRIRRHAFDLIHRLTPLSPVMPSLLAARCRRAGVPFVLGPLNGGVPWPRTFDAVRRREKEWLSYLRGAYKLLPGHRATLRHARAILVGSRDTWRQMPPEVLGRCVYVPENAIDPDRFPLVPPRRPPPPLRVIFLGRLVPYKGPDMLIDASAPLVREGKLDVELIGDGPERSALEAQIRRLGLQDRIRLVGWIRQSDVHRRLGEAHVFAFPSIREFGGAVILEAMACGAVPIAVDYGGPSELITESTGYRISLGTRDQIVAALRRALERIVDAPGRLDPLRRAGIRRARTLFTWRAKAAQVLDVYRWVLGQIPDRPDFGMPLPDADP